MDEDPYNLARFVEAQAPDYDRALSEIRRGHKQSHWMWYVFPQLQGLGNSSMSRLYAIRSLAEARAYLDHPVLGPRLIDCAEAVLAIPDRTAKTIFGSPDDLKLRSSATLFAAASRERPSVFDAILEKYFDGRGDETTQRLLAGGGAAGSGDSN